MRKLYFAIYPSKEGSITEEWEQCLDGILGSVSSEHTVVKINVFADLPDFMTLLDFREKIMRSVSENFRDCCPAFNLTIHPPEKPWKIAVEVSAISGRSVKCISRRFREIPYVVIESDSSKEIWSAGISSYKFPDDTFMAATDAFNMMVDLLAAENMSLNNIVRQWNYIGNILSIEGGSQNYQVFNEVRKDFYSRFRESGNYPAATGVGMKSGNVILDFRALDLKDPSAIVPVNNPDQINAYEYGQDVLKESLITKGSVKHPPKFERALITRTSNVVHMHISGTASIIGQETVGRDNIEQQTLTTIRNIHKLTEIEHVNKLFHNESFSHVSFSLIRVYIKSMKDLKVVRQICNEHFPGIPALFIEADICRDDLLMEIEAEVELNQ